ncbi:MAG: hypothetical protein IJB26_06290 [Clostridia bacterium]|nr:hypothetical protein [Clostridia bacterium]
MEMEERRPVEVAPEESMPIEEAPLPTQDEQTVLPPQAEIAPCEDAAEEETADESDITHRLAEEFILLREEFPSIERPDQLPDAVLDMAAEKSISLFDAYLRFCHEERKRVEREQQRRQQAAASSAGSLQQGTVDTHPEQDAFLRAFRTALK